MNLQEIEFLAGLMKQNGLTALTVEEGNFKIKLERDCAPAAQVVMAAPAAVAASQQPQSAAPVEEALQPGYSQITAPMVGVFYSTPSPDAQPFVTIGSAVHKGDVLCIIAAMKLMNEVVAEEDGVIADICLQNGQVAEYGQPLFKIKKN